MTALATQVPESQQIQLLLNTDNNAATRRSRQLARRAQQLGQGQELMEAYWLLGSALRNKSRFDSSLYYGHQALILASKLGLQEGVSNAYALLAQTYKRLADGQHVKPLTTKALSLSSQAVAAARQGPYPVALSRAYILQGIIYRDLCYYDSARLCYQRAIQLAQRHPSRPSSLPVAYADYGQLLMDADHNLPAAITYFRRTLPLYRQENNRNGLEHAYRNLSWAYRQQGQLAAALHTADTCLVLGRASGDPHRLSNSLHTVYLAYRESGQMAQALVLLEEMKKLTDSFANADIARAVASHQATYELAQQQAHIAQLSQHNAHQRQLLWIFGLGAIVLLAMLALLVWQYRIIQRSNVQLSRNNLIISDNNRIITNQSARLELLLRELHHRVKNNLAVVAGLLRLQANRLTDPEAARTARESQQRVEAMLLIHQGLYQTEDVTTIDIRHYVTDLVQSLSVAYHFPASEADLSLEIAPLRLDVDVAVPLGLILNELLTNAFKHAFALPRTERAFLRVVLASDSNASLILEVHDNGPGFDPKLARAGSFGQRLINALTEQLGGQLTLDNDQGTHFRLVVPATALAEA